MKNLSRSLIYLVLFLVSLMSVNAIVQDDVNTQGYYKLEDLVDSTGILGDLTNNGATSGATGIIDDAYSFITNDYLINDVAYDMGNVMSISIWFKTTATGINANIFSRWGATRHINIGQDTVDKIFIIWYASPTSFKGKIETVGTYNDGDWHHLVITQNGDTGKMYIDDVLIGTDTTVGKASSVQKDEFGSRSLGTANFWDGSLDEISLWNKTLNSTEVSYLFNGGAPTSAQQFPFSLGATVTTNNPIENEFLDNLNFSLNVTTDLNTNLTYSLNGASNVTLGTNINSSVSTITGIEESNTIIVYSNFSGEITDSGLRTFTIDTIDPSINNSIPSTISSYQFLDTYFSCTDTNLVSCNISVASLNKASDLNFTLPLNGNLSYTITAIDLAGNSVTDVGTLFVNPLQYFRFIDDLGANVTNYSFSGFNFTQEAAIPIYSIGLGSQFLAFEKDGYITSHFPLTLNTTSEFNITYNVFVSRIIINVYNQLTKQLLTNETLDLNLIGPTNLFTNTTTGTFNLSSFLIGGEYQLFITSTNFFSVQDDFIFNGSGVKQIDFYMLPNNSSQVGFINIITYKEDNTFFPEIPVTALEWDSATNTFIQTYEIFTNTNGLATIPVILENRIYKFCADYPTGTTCFPTSILGITISTAQNGDTFPILPDRDFPSVPLNAGALQITIDNISLTNYSDSFYNYSVNYNWENTLGLTSTVCTRIEKDFNFSTTNIVDTCSSSSTGIYSNTFLLNNSFSYIFIIYSLEGVVETEQFRQNIAGTNTFFSFLEKFNIKIILQILVVVLMVGIIPYIKNPLLIMLDIILAFFVSWRYLIPQDLSIISVGVMIIMCAITLWTVSKK